MKKFYLSIVLIFAFTAHVFAQAVLETEDHTLRPGDEHPFVIVENAEEGPAGASEVWDFSDLEKESEFKSKMLSSGFVDNSEKIPEANVVLEENGTHFFFEVSKSGMKQYGTITKNNSVIQYDKPFVKMVYPFEYGDSKEGKYSGKLITSKNEKEFNGKYNIQVDGYGKLKLPGGVVIDDVVRLKTEKTKQYEGSSNESTIVSYKWYCSQVRYPLLTIIKSKREDKSHYLKSAYYADAGLIDQDEDRDEKKEAQSENSNSEVKIFPNPFRNNFTVEYQLGSSQDVEINVFNSSGQMVKDIRLDDQRAGSYSKEISTNGEKFSEGMYYINIKTEEGEHKESLMKVK
ncbi:MAG: T9SS type A sorting domain-containing protein [Bacteroidota bacterium]